MLEFLLHKLPDGTLARSQRAEGVPFFKVTKSLYGALSVEYLALNIPVATRQKHFAQCTYSDHAVSHCITIAPVLLDPVLQRRFNEPIRWNPNDWPAEWIADEDRSFLTFPLRSRLGEIVVFGILLDTGSEVQEQSVIRELRVLANYFHNHVLRINGHNSDDELLISARELDCLKWTAAGKTAWEASVILGISERTVRFHLNGAREKLECATTTQAVAKAVANQLIDF
jgi:DNA-binding CsgD family transcriptional regulator